MAKADFHFHLGSARIARDADAAPAGCAISRAAGDNIRYLAFSRTHRVACALFTHPRSTDYETVVSAIRDRAALSYQHLELVGGAEFVMLAPALEAAEAEDLPVVVHLSRHDANRFPAADAARLLGRILSRYPGLRVVVSHCGGENIATAASAARDCSRVFLDTSRFEETILRSGIALSELAERVPPSQLVYGSDSVWAGRTAQSCDGRTLARAFGGEYLDRIFARNARALLRSWRGSIAAH